MDAIDKLRSDAVNSLEAHTSGVRKMTAYAAQLVWMGGKFPIDVSELHKTRAHAGFEGLTRLLRLASTFHGTQRWVSTLKDRVRKPFQSWVPDVWLSKLYSITEQYPIRACKRPV